MSKTIKITYHGNSVTGLNPRFDGAFLNFIIEYDPVADAS